MSFFNQIIQKLRPNMSFYESIVYKKTMKMIRGDKGIAFEFASNGCKLIDVANLKNVSNEGMASSINAYVYAHALVNGPKVFKPNVKNLEALEQMTLSVDFSSYVQPFPTVIIEFPEEYSKKMIVKNNCVDPSFGFTEQHDPSYVMLHHAPELQIVLVNVQFTSGSVYNSIVWPAYGDKSTLEQILQGLVKLDHYEGSLPVTADEGAVAMRVIRAALNCVLVMEEFGVKKLGPQNESHYNRLARRANEQRDLNKRLDAEREMTTMPIIYSFDQDVKLYTELNVRGAETHREGIPVTCHWRTGHWRMQHFGPGNSQTKKIRIAAVLVNGHRFGGKLEDTTYTKEV